MRVKHCIEKPDGSVVFQGVLEGAELAFVIEMGLEAVIAAGAGPFVSTEHYGPDQLHDVPDTEQ